MPFKLKIRLIVLTILFCVLSANLLRGTFSLLQSGRRLKEEHKEVSVLQKQKEELERELGYRQTDEYVEEKARNDLNLIKPGEKVYVVTGNTEEQKFSPNQDDFKVLASATQEGSGIGEVRGMQSKVWYMWYKLFFF